MTTWFIVPPLVILSLVGWRLTFRFLLDEVTFGKPDTEDIVMAIFIATLCLWFIDAAVAIGVALWWVGSRIAHHPSPAQVARFLGGESRADKRRRLEHEREEREAYIARLERELHIGED